MVNNYEYIHNICKKYNIQNYIINDNNSIDVNDLVNLSYKGLKNFPLNFRNVTENFYCQHNKLNSLEGCPKSVGGNFICNNNQLTSLRYCPKNIGGSFFCYHNQIRSLEGFPENIVRYFISIGNPIYSLVGNWINEPNRDSMVEYFNDLDVVQGDRVILDRLEEFMDIYNVEINLKEVEEYYKIV